MQRPNNAAPALAMQFLLQQPNVQLPIPLAPDGSLHTPLSFPNILNLREGKELPRPTMQFGSLRLRLLHKGFALDPSYSGTILFTLQIAAEPKVQWRKATALHIERAVDDQGQNLTQAPAVANLTINEDAEAAPPRGSLMPLRLKRGDKPAKKIKELRGTIAAEVLTTPETLLTIDDALKADGQRYPLPDGGEWKLQARRKDKEISLRVEFTRMPKPIGPPSRYVLTMVRGNKDSSEEHADEIYIASFLEDGSPPTPQNMHVAITENMKPLRLILHRQRGISFVIPFVFTDVPLP
jgi:hypothetical protein